MIGLPPDPMTGGIVWLPLPTSYELIAKGEVTDELAYLLARRKFSSSWVRPISKLIISQE